MASSILWNGTSSLYWNGTDELVPGECQDTCCQSQDPGACCVAGNCVDGTSLSCSDAGGSFHPGLVCAAEPNLCFTSVPGACCQGTTCSQQVFRVCSGIGGSFLGPGVPCVVGTCGAIPTGCCQSNPNACITGAGGSSGNYSLNATGSLADYQFLGQCACQASLGGSSTIAPSFGVGASSCLNASHSSGILSQYQRCGGQSTSQILVNVSVTQNSANSWSCAITSSYTPGGCTSYSNVTTCSALGGCAGGQLSGSLTRSGTGCSDQQAGCPTSLVVLSVEVEGSFALPNRSECTSALLELP